MLPASELEAMRTTLPQLGVTLTVSQPEPGWQGFEGTAPSALQAYLAQTGDPMDI